MGEKDTTTSVVLLEHAASETAASSTTSKSPALPRMLRRPPPPSPTHQDRSESCGSSHLSGLMELDRKLILALYKNKFLLRGGDQWRGSDDNVLRMIKQIEFAHNMTMEELRERVIAMEKKAKCHKEGTEQIVNDLNSWLYVFEYVMPDNVPVTPTDDMEFSPKIYIPSNPAGRDIFKSPMNMTNCTEKIMRCGFKGELLFRGLELLKADWDLREVFITLEDSKAKDYLLRVIDKSR